MSAKETAATFTVTADGKPLRGAEVQLVSANGTHLGGITDEKGQCTVTLPDRRPATLFCAHPEHAGLVIPNVEPEESCSLTMEKLHGGGSALILEGSGHIPGLSGRLNPIKDTLDRTYIYGDNLSFDDQPSQPFYFRLGEPFYVEDAHRRRFELVILAMIGRQAVCNFRSRGVR